MTVNELITTLDLMPADAPVLINQEDGTFEDIGNVRLADSGEVVLEVE